MASLLISAAHKSSGKTTITLGLCAALRKRGLKVQSFKKGPDYIDPMWLSLASGNPCYNLDFFTQGNKEITEMFQKKSYGTDISIVEGNKGLSDGLDLDGSNSSAALATLLETPVVMVIDTQGITRSVAPLILGFQKFEPDVTLAGIILNKVGGERHADKLKRILNEYTDIPVLGSVQRDKSLEIVERHLGLMPSNETSDATKLIENFSEKIADQVNLDQLLDIASKGSIGVFDSGEKFITDNEISIGILRDEAFGFYYPDDLETFEKYGARLVFIDSINDKKLPDIDGLFIGGGFPEVRMNELEKNSEFRKILAAKINSGLPVYAECGGLMYLCTTIKWLDNSCKMLGVIDATAVMHDRPVGRGYVYLEDNRNHPWYGNDKKKSIKRPAHEFHYSALEFDTLPDTFCYNVLRGKGIMNSQDGLLQNNIIATYTHQRNTESNPWIREFLGFVRNIKKQGNRT